MVEPLENRRLLSITSIPAVPVPAAAWTLDEGAGTTAADSSGNGHNLTLSSGASWIGGNVGAHALRFDGTANGVATATGPVVDTSGSFTVSAWVDLNNLNGYQTFVSISGANVSGFFLQLRGDTGAISFARIPADNEQPATVIAASSAPATNTWYHAVAVDDATAGTLTLYIDGQSQGSVPFTSGWKATGDTLVGHGFYNGGQTDYVNGAVDNVAFYSSALSAAQVAALDQPAAYSFDDGSGTTAADVSGHGNTLTLGSGVTWTTGHIGSNALAFNGTSNGTATNASPVLNTTLPFSVSAWVKLNSLSSTQTFASIDGTRASAFALQYRTDTGKFAFTRTSSDSNTPTQTHADATAAPSTGTWYNLIGVYNPVGSSLQLYVNGVLQNSVAFTGGWQGTGATVIGAGRVNGARTNFANATIDDVHFYNSPLSASAAATIGNNNSSTINIGMGSTGVTVSPNLFGAFMEDINYGGDGGIYNDEVRNSGFNDSSSALNAWAAVTGTGVSANLSSDTSTGPTSALTQSAALAVTSGVSASSRVGISNSGYFGLAVAPSTTYSVDFWAKATAGFTGPLTVDIESTTGTVWATATINAISTNWAEYTATLTTNSNAPLTSSNLFVISTNSASANGQTLWFGATYLNPPAYQNQANHLRADLMNWLQQLHPGIFRVPGGNYLEGNDYADRFNWSATIGPDDARTGHNNPWGYWSTDGMGLDEYLQMAEEVGSQPILAVYAGYTLNGSTDTGQTLTDDVTSAINELHYCLDPVTTSWGALRAANGHPAPYNVKYVEVGNEDFFSNSYSARYPLFYNAIRASFPTLKIIATTSGTGGTPFDVLDDHFYNSPSWFESNSNHYDNYTRGSYQIFVGEYAANEGNPTNDMNSALGDAAWLLGLERNSDLVAMSSYAPLWVNVSSHQWTPDLIGFNNTTSYASPSYYAQQILNLNRGTTVVPNMSITGASGLQGLVTRTGSTYYLTFINTGSALNSATINLNGITSVSSTASVTSLTAFSGGATNSITNPNNIVPVTSTATGLAPSFNYTFPGYSITVLQFNATVDTPNVATPAAANPNPVTGTTTNLSVLGADPVYPESSLTYTWASTGPAAVNYSVNGTNASKNTTATFSAAGTYHFTVTITNPTVGSTTTSSIDVTVNQTPSGFAISPSSYTLVPGGTLQLTAGTVDQFGAIISYASPTWSIISGQGTVTPSGLFVASASPGATTVQAVSGGSTATATFTITNATAFYKTNESSGTTLSDSSGNNNTANLTGSYAFSSGVSGNALALSGGYASLPTGIVSSLTNFTIATWINPSSLANWARIFDFGTGTNVNMFLTPDAGGTNALRFAITNSGNNNEQRLDGPAISTGVWTHVAITLSGTNATLYVNGIPVANNPNMTLNPSSLGITNQNYLGKSQYSDPAYNGSIDDFRIYASALTAQQVFELANPTFVYPAAAPSSSINSGSTTLSALGTDVTAGEPALTYTWSAIGTPPGPVTFTNNGTNAGKNTTATFTTAGTYTLQVSIVNPIANITTTSTVTLTVLAGDANRDGKVDGADLAIVLANFGSKTSAWTSGNFDGSSTIDLTDFAIVLNNFGASLSTPHPASATDTNSSQTAHPTTPASTTDTTTTTGSAAPSDTTSAVPAPTDTATAPQSSSAPTPSSQSTTPTPPATLPSTPSSPPAPPSVAVPATSAAPSSTPAHANPTPRKTTPSSSKTSAHATALPIHAPIGIKLRGGHSAPLPPANPTKEKAAHSAAKKR